MSGRHRWEEIAQPILRDPIRRQRVAAYERAMRDILKIVEARAALGFDASMLPDFSDSLERVGDDTEDPYLATLRRYAEALGGRLEVSVVFPEGVVSVPVASG